MNISIVWFKNDLRLLDNEVMFRALSESDQIVPFYCLDQNQFKTTGFGFKKTGHFRAKFLLESLLDLHQQLQHLGSGLIIRKGNPEIELPKLALQNSVTRVFSKKEVGYEELKTQERVTRALSKVKCQLLTFENNTLFHSEDLPFEISKTPESFTQFRNRVENSIKIRSLFPLPDKIYSPFFEPFQLPDLCELGLNNIFKDARSSFPFKGGETNGINRVSEYFEKTHSISKYKQTRNELFGLNYSSKFSPWLSVGSISPRYIYHQLKKYESQYYNNESTYWLLFELYWRDYFILMMKKYPHQFFTRLGINKTANPNKFFNHNLLFKWINGETDSDFINASMLELKYTGFMSNRGRQNVASYLSHNLQVDWRYGAAYFEQQLIDYDVSSNWCNWAYIAGVGNNPRGASVFNVEKQADEYDKNKMYRNLWIPKV